MKFKLIILCLLVCSKAYQQSEAVGQLFVLKANTDAKFVQLMLNTGSDTITAPGSDVTVQEKVLYVLKSVDQANKKVYFYAKDFPLSIIAKNRMTNKDKSYYYNDKLFEMSYDDYKRNADNIEYPDRINFGILTLPFKFRPQKNSGFDPQFNLNTTVGYLLTPKYYRKSKIYAQGGAGIGTVSLDASNARGITEDSAQNISTITGFFGLMLQYNNIQAGLYLGADKINNNDKYDWADQGNMWLSLGVGFKIFTLQKEDVPTQ